MNGSKLSFVFVLCGLSCSVIGACKSRSFGDANSLVSQSSEEGSLPVFKLSTALYDTQNEPFESHANGQSYLALNVPYKPVKDLIQGIESTYSVKLKSRGEAHITIITPVEYSAKLAKVHMTIAEIEKIARQNKIQELNFSARCIGRFPKDLNESKPQEMSVYYIVIDSPEIITLRQKIKDLFVAKGGDPEEFSAVEGYRPHITIGFTKKDLHESNGAVKDKSSCVANFKETDDVNAF